MYFLSRSFLEWPLGSDTTSFSFVFVGYRIDMFFVDSDRRLHRFCDELLNIIDIFSFGEPKSFSSRTSRGFGLSGLAVGHLSYGSWGVNSVSLITECDFLFGVLFGVLISVEWYDCREKEIGRRFIFNFNSRNKAFICISIANEVFVEANLLYETIPFFLFILLAYLLTWVHIFEMGR